MPGYNEQNITLDRYSIGEIAELAGFPDYYNAGSSQWIRSAVYVAAANISTVAKTAFQNNTAPVNTVALNSDAAVDTAGLFAAIEAIPRLSGSSVSVVVSGKAALSQVGTISSSGIQIVNTGQTNFVTGTSGASVAVTSDNTNIWAFSPSSSSAIAVSKSTNGTSFAAQSPSSFPTLSFASSTYNGMANSNITRNALGDQIGTSGAGKFFAYNCGARHLLVTRGTSGTNWVASRATDPSSTWGGDESTTVLGSGSLAIASTNYAWSYKNGNNFVFMLDAGSTARYTTDGGVTWGNCTNAPAINSTMFFKRNSSTAAKIACFDTSSTTAKFSADSGATWTSRTLPVAPTTAGGAAYTGSTCLIVVAGVLYRSTDDGATWSTITLPAATGGTLTSVFGDTNRFYLYFGTTASQILTGTDGSAWTIRALTPLSIASITGIASFNSNSVMLFGSSGAIYTNDGGVTWGVSAMDTVSRNSLQGGDAYITADGGGFTVLGVGIGSDTAASIALALTDMSSGPSFYRTGATTITPLRANAVCYQRIG